MFHWCDVLTSALIEAISGSPLSFFALWQSQSNRWYWKLVPVSVLRSVPFSVSLFTVAGFIVPAGKCLAPVLSVPLWKTFDGYLKMF